MKKEEIQKQLSIIFEDIFNLAGMKIGLDTEPQIIKDWDSLGHVRLISAIEEEFQILLAAVVLGITSLERHITLDRTMWGSDQAAALERHGLEILIRDAKVILTALGDGKKRIYPGELRKRKVFRGY